ncbi:MAG: MotA/TolQ/ExbB proton channel family protein [Zoogloeaceae bacterium]|nr:MotA/TolQ/ExbB proton channel family protein [Zoogloeaceae bacterium]
MSHSQFFRFQRPGAFLRATALLAFLLGGNLASAQEAAPPADVAAPVTEAESAPAAVAEAASAEAAPAPNVSNNAGADDKIEVDNPYGVEALWKGSDFVAKGTLVILLIMSFGSWLIILTKLYEQQKLFRHGKAANKTFWEAGNIQQAVETLPAASAYRYIVQTGHEATEKHSGLLGHIAFNDWLQLSIQRAIENVQNRLQDGLAFLATVGSTAPFIGLFGTVWGIYHALTAIGIAGQASIDKVAGPVGESLIMTALGLAVAVPAVLGYNWLVRRNKAALEDVRAFGAELHAVLLGSRSAQQDERESGAPARIIPPVHAVSA